MLRLEIGLYDKDGSSVDLLSMGRTYVSLKERGNWPDDIDLLNRCMR